MCSGILIGGLLIHNRVKSRWGAAVAMCWAPGLGASVYDRWAYLCDRCLKMLIGGLLVHRIQSN